MKQQLGQISFFEIIQPEWQECFKSCKHFDSHPDFMPDLFPSTNIKRCQYCDHQYGSSGKQFRIEVENNKCHMYCVHYEEKGL